ncbi:MAG: T9SS type A sorting domain-containing protein, partial [Candidatus Delongbacteria bacterium]|nr:T9SS type A sorting domain-containing protein [Candidatus Delongbacteria bacterium]
NFVPCIKTIGLIPEGEIPRPILIYAPENYWGSNVNDSFFALSEPYYIDYSNYSTVPYGSVPLTSTGPDNDQASKFLSKALEAELDGKYDKAIKTYEKIIEKYPDSSEALVAYAKLPDSYTQESLSIEPLIEMYDMNIAIENSNKKFFKELKVSSHIKAKNYDTAIALSEEMKLEAGTEDEIILCDLDIAIANMLKDAENKGKSRTESSSADLAELLGKLTGGEDKGEPANITDAVIPETSKLYQNYPNPFNPVTQIKFDLAKAGNVKLSVYNINGQRVAELLNGVQNAGIHTIEFDGSNLNSGVYYYTLESAGSSFVQKMVLMK